MSRVVGIFSRDGDLSYRFLADFLRGEDGVSEVRSVPITNNGFQRLQEEASRCHCAILYHSKNRGRLNITNVTDSLYDEELRYLSGKLGSENVLVVADDLDSSSSGVKEKMLRDQPLIGETAAQLFLFSRTDKNSEDLLTEKLREISSHIWRTVPRRSEPIRSLPEVVGPLQPIFNLLNWCFMMPIGVAQFIYDKCVMMPIGVARRIYDKAEQCVMDLMPKRVAQFIYDKAIQCFMMPIGVARCIYDKAKQSVMDLMAVRLVRIMYDTAAGLLGPGKKE